MTHPLANSVWSRLVIVKRSTITLVTIALCAQAAACTSGSGAVGHGNAATLINPSSDRVIAFTAQTGTQGKDTREQVFVALPGGKAQQLTHGRDSHEALAWTNDGSRLVIAQQSFQSHHYRASLVTVAIDGGPPVPLARIPRGFGLAVAPNCVTRPCGWSGSPVSPDASLLLLEGGEGNVGGGLYVETIRDGSLRRVAMGVAEGVDGSSVAWSPDGRRIAYVHHSLVSGSVDITNFDGTGHTTVVHPDQLPGWWGTCGKGPYARGLPRRGDQCFYRDWPDHVEWTHDGSHLVFDANNKLYSVNADGTALTRLTAGAPNGELLSPDGSHLAGSNYIHTSGLPATGSNYVMKLDGTHVTLIPGCGCGIGWSPDSTQLAVVEAGAVWVVNVDGSGLAQVTPNLDYQLFDPIWRPNPQ